MHNNKITDRTKSLFFRSDMLTTRALVGLSSILFAIAFLPHVIEKHEFHDFFWLVLSLVHGTSAFYALYKNVATKLTFVGEAVCGFILWNYIAITVSMQSSNINDPQFPCVAASLSPIIITGMATWWILSRYPKINHNKNKK